MPANADPTPRDYVAPVRWWLHCLALVTVSLAVGLVLLSPPGFGDELTYWSLAFDLHEVGSRAWGVHSFHDLRWPVWGPLWVWLGLFGSGLASFYFEPLALLAAAAVLAFTFGRLILRSLSGAWICGIALIFAPVLDAVAYRPMPDLGETVFGSCALLAWWQMMREERRGRAVFFGVLSGLAIGLAFSNRVTGIFIAPVLAVATFVFFPRRWQWLFLPAIFAAAFFAAECAVYYSVCGDWLHSIHANLGGQRAKDVEVTALWRLPIRYLDGFFRGNRLAPIYGGLMVLGLWSAWRKCGREGRLLVVWFGVLYFEYSCAVQSVNPVRPLIGSTFRYLATLTMPQSVLVAAGFIEVCGFLRARNFRWTRPIQAAVERLPALAGAAAVALLVVLSSRPFFDLGFVPGVRSHMASLPAGTRIFSHHGMYDIACLVDAGAAHRFAWVAPKHILLHDPQNEEQAAGCDQLWTARKLLWMAERKEVERGLPRKQPALGSYIADPERDWILANIVVKEDEPAFVFYRRRPAGAPEPHVLSAVAPEFTTLIPPLPVSWDSLRHKRIVNVVWPVPPALRGKLANLEIEAASAGVEAMTVKLRFVGKTKRREFYELRPILYAGGGEDHFAVPIPADAEQCMVEAKFTRKTNAVRLTAFRVVYDETR